MEFADAASYFDQDEVFDAYTDELLFLAHTTPHDDHTSSGSTSRRRTLIAAVDTEMPARRAIRWYDTFWVVGGNNADAFQGDEVRRSYGLKKSSGLMTVVTLGQACLATANVGTQLHAHKEYYRDMTDSMTSSDYDVMYNVFVAAGEMVGKGLILEQNGRFLLIRNVYESADEFLVAEADSFDSDARQQIVFQGQPGLDFDTAAAASSVTTFGLQTDSSKFYVFRLLADGTSQPGDRTVFVARSAVTPTVGTTFTMQDLLWRVTTVVAVGDAWALRARLV